MENYLVIRFEDLVTNTYLTMKRISQFLSIEFYDVLLTPTIDGRLWKGNSSTNEKFISVSTTPLEKWKNKINDFEIISVNKRLGHVINKYNYDILIPRHNKYRQYLEPSKGEKPITYIKNRLDQLIS